MHSHFCQGSALGYIYQTLPSLSHTCAQKEGSGNQATEEDEDDDEYYDDTKIAGKSGISRGKLEADKAYVQLYMSLKVVVSVF